MTRTLATRSILAAAAAAVAAAGLATGMAARTTPAGATKTVTVTLKEFRLVPSTRALAAGRVTFVAVNRGKLPHELALKGAGASAHTAVLAPGKTARFTVTLKNGSYSLWCPLGTHASAGMKISLRVGAAAGGGGGGGAGSTTSTPIQTTTDPGGYDGY